MTMRSRWMLAGAAAAVVLAAVTPAALAHAAYKSSNPADESTVASPPSQVTAEFTEPLTDASSMQVFDPCGQQVDNGDSNPSGYEMTVSMSGDKAGRYIVEFKAQSALDSHVTSGSFTFTSSGGAPCPGSEPPPGSGDGGGNGGGGGGTSDPDPGEPLAAEDPGTSAASNASGSGGSASRGDARAGRGGAGSEGRQQRPRAGGSGRGRGPVAFQNTGETVPPREPAPWDLPVDGVVLAFVLCVLIGAAGGRVYAGIVAPPRR